MIFVNMCILSISIILYLKTFTCISFRCLESLLVLASIWLFVLALVTLPPADNWIKCCSLQQGLIYATSRDSISIKSAHLQAHNVVDASVRRSMNRLLHNSLFLFVFY